ncbi:hypothetical protein SAPIO_CDS7844 [Scedosporium apiospermum]|uniref:Adhesin domain-containing protein n=1 Tax=Pseudallescheria apiosperma TaxID=563466 RepID=A0A084G0T4_PSEDA|nr:uncharacterized protein SAPIO_CDS7844 [Scedosporium apiospermum]KEZ40946.1 hypothetical protein SAPIO_CDS7844 [Scedosporium apiospermum]
MAKSPESQGLLDPKFQSTTDRVVTPKRCNARRFIRAILWVAVPVLIFFSFFGGKTVLPKFGRPCHGTSSDLQSPSLQSPDAICGTSFQTILDDSYPVSFSPSDDLFINQSQGKRRRGHWRRDPHVSGSVQVIRSSGPEGKLDVKIEVNDEDIPVHTSWDAETQYLRIRVEAVDFFDEPPPRPCVDIHAVLHVPSDAELRNLKIEVTALDVALEENLGLTAEEAILTTVVGSLDVAPNAIKSGGRIALTTVSGNIRGSLPLLQTLESFSASGKNEIDVYRTEKRGDDIPKATLTVSTVSGNLKVRDPLDDAAHLPKADYVRRVSTVSGNIDAALLFGSYADISAVGGGRVDTTLLPILFDSLSGNDEGERGDEDFVHSWLKSDVTSGNVGIEVLEPVWLGESDKKWALRSGHGGVSGNVEIRLPDAWEGTFAVGTLTGRISVSGKDVQLGTRQEGGEKVDMSAFRSIRGYKGDGESRLSAETTTGNIKVVIGQE